MRLVITDSAKIWNVDNPYLEKYKDIILVVCLDGIAVTDKYECFLVKADDSDQTTDFGDLRLKNLLNVERNMEDALGYHDDIIFLCNHRDGSVIDF